LASLFQNLPQESPYYLRLVAKFEENNGEKCGRLVEIWDKFFGFSNDVDSRYFVLLRCSIVVMHLSKRLESNPFYERLRLEIVPCAIDVLKGHLNGMDSDSEEYKYYCALIQSE